MRRRQHAGRPMGRRASMDPQAFIAALLDDLRRVIAHGGLHVQGVLGDGDQPGWSYTVGLHSFDLPELIVIGGLDHRNQHGVLLEAADRMRADGPFETGRREPDLLEGYDATFIAVADTDSHHFAVANRLQRDFQALQLVWPDHDNRFPWEEGCAVPPELQPLLGLPQA